MPYSPFRHIPAVLWKRSPVQLTFFVTRKCNANCSFCFYRSQTAESTVPELSLNEITKISASMGNLLWLAFSGGEPFLREDLVDIVKIFYGRNKPSVILLPTNGLLPDLISEKTEAILQACPNSIVAVKLSLDGPEDLHDSLRGVSGAFRSAMDTYERLRPLMSRYPNGELGFNSVLCSENQHHMGKLLDFVGARAPGLTHTVSLIRGEVRDEGLKDVDPDQYRYAADRMAAGLEQGRSGTYRFGGARLKVAQDILQRRLILETLVKRKRLIPCYAGRINLVLTETGDVYPCESFTHGMGNVRQSEYKVGKLLKTSEARAGIRAVRESGCFCTHECYMMTNILFSPFQYPSLLNEYLRLLLSRRLGAAGRCPSLSRSRTDS